MKAPVGVLLDTHVFVAWFERPNRLSLAQRRAIQRAGDAAHLYVSDITLWETAMLVERGRVRLALPLREWLDKASAPPRVHRVGMPPAVLAELVGLSATADWDPADRILVATARVLGAALVTSDERIIDSKLVQTIG